jgi:hypothetical protein
MGQIRPYEEDGELACTIQIKKCHEENREGDEPIICSFIYLFYNNNCWSVNYTGTAS